MTSQQKNLTPLFFVIFIDTVGYFLVMPILLRLFINVDTSILPTSTSMATRQWLYSVTLVLSPIAFILLSPLAGRLSDRFGRKKVIYACLVISFLGFAIPILGIDFKQASLIMFGRFIAGAGTTSQPVAQAAITDFSTGKQRAFNLSMIGLSMTLAMIIGPLMGGYLSDPNIVSWFTPSTPYWTSVVLTLVNITLLHFTFHDRDPIKNSQKTSERHIFQLLTRATVPLLFAFFCLEITWSAYYQSCFLFLHAVFHFNTSRISTFAAYSGVWMCLGLTLICKLWLRRSSITKIAQYSMIALTISYTILLIRQSFVDTHWIMVIPAALFCGTAYPTLLELISENTPKEHQGWILGVASTLLGFAWMVTGFFAGALTNLGIQAITLTTLISILLGTLCLTLYKPKK